MKSISLLAAMSLAGSVPAFAISYSLDFESASSGSEASAFNTSSFSFHNAVYLPKVDSYGVEIPGTERWVADTDLDAILPVLVNNPETEGWGAAPSGTNALDARFGPILLQFTRPFWLSGFSVTLDDSFFGDAGFSSILFLSGSMIVNTLDFDASIPKQTLSLSGLADVTGVVLNGGAFYDDLNIDVTAVPDQGSSLALLSGAALLGAALRRRREA